MELIESQAKLMREKPSQEAKKALKKYKKSKSNQKTDKQFFRVYTATIGEKLKSIPTEDDVMRNIQNIYDRQNNGVQQPLDITTDNFQNTVLAESQRIERNAKAKLSEEKRLRNEYRTNQSGIENYSELLKIIEQVNAGIEDQNRMIPTNFDPNNKTGLNPKSADIQKNIRAKLDQQKYKQKLEDENIKKVATKIQSLVRGVKAREQVKEQVREQVKEQKIKKDSATKIQSLVRGVQGRKATTLQRTYKSEKTELQKIKEDLRTPVKKRGRPTNASKAEKEAKNWGKFNESP